MTSRPAAGAAARPREPRFSTGCWAPLCLIVLAGCATPPCLSPSPVPMIAAPGQAVSAFPEASAFPPRSRIWSPTVEEAVQRALACNSQLQALRAAVSVAEQRRRAAADLADPELKFAWGQNNGDELRSQWSARDTTSQSTGKQTSQSTRTTEGATVAADGSPLSTSSSSQTTADDTLSSSRATQTSSTLTSGNTTDSGDGWRIDARFFVPNPWLLIPRVDARKAEIQAVNADLRAATWRVTCDVRRLFSELNYLALDRAAAEELVRLDGDILKTVQSRGAQGNATASDILSASRRHLQTQDNLDQTCHRFKLAQRGLAALLNVSPATLNVGTNMTVFSSLPTETLSFDRAENIALRRRGDVEALHWRLTAATAAYREARNVRLPWIKEIDASYRSSLNHTWGTDATTGSRYGSGATSRSTTDSGRSQGTKTATDGTVENTSETIAEQSQANSYDTSSGSEYGTSGLSNRQRSEEWWVGFAVDVPIFSWLMNHGADVLLAQYKLAAVNETEGLQVVRNELRDALDEVDECRRQQARYNADVAPAIAEMRQTLTTLKSTPNAMPDQVAATEAQLAESLRLDLGARWRYRLALLDLERAVGAPLADVLKP